jgi:hypothetical protein
LKNKAETKSPNIDKDTPEIIIKSSRIIQPENEKVSNKCDCIEQQCVIYYNSFFQNKQNKAQERW